MLHADGLHLMSNSADGHIAAASDLQQTSWGTLVHGLLVLLSQDMPAPAKASRTGRTMLTPASQSRRSVDSVDLESTGSQI